MVTLPQERERRGLEDLSQLGLGGGGGAAAGFRNVRWSDNLGSRVETMLRMRGY